MHPSIPGQVPTEGVDSVLQKSSRSSGHQSGRHRTRDKSRDRDQDRDRDKDWPPEKHSDSHSPVNIYTEGISGWDTVVVTYFLKVFAVYFEYVC